jgi:hypothetical protein
VGATGTRNIQPTVAYHRAMLGPLVRDGRHEEAQQVRRELAEAKFLSDIDRAVDAYLAKNGPLTDEALIDSIATHLGGGR